MSRSDVLRIDTTWYDTRSLAKVHPGGELTVLLSNQTDATALFHSSHRRRFPHQKYKAHAVDERDVAASVKQALPPLMQSYDIFFEICDRVKPLLAATGGFAPRWYFVKVFILLAVVLGLDVLSFFVTRSYWSTVLQSLFMAWIGLNIQHDANHGAVSANPLVNRALGLCQDLCGGASVAWVYNHNIVHHVHCNDVHKDHDLDIPLLRLMERISWRFFHKAQHLYFLFGAAIFGPVHVLQNQLWIWRGPRDQMASVATAVQRDWNLSKAISIIIPLRMVGFLLTQPTLIDALLHSFLQYSVGGLYLATFFLISHNFVGARKEGIDSSKGCFVTNQVETSCNVGGAWLAFLNGGLNFQIEHHLFPRVHHSFYPIIAPVVRKVCEAHHIGYMHFPSLRTNLLSTFLHLEHLGNTPTSSEKALAADGAEDKKTK